MTLETTHRKPARLLGALLLSLLLATLLAAACSSSPPAGKSGAATATPEAAPAQSAESHRLDLESFDVVWTTLQDRFWDPEMDGIDWEGVREELRPRMEAAQSRDEARKVLDEMIGRLGRTHFGIIRADAYRALNPEEGEDGRPPGSAATGVDPRVLDGRAVVFRVEPGSPAAEAGVRPGWAIEAVDGKTGKTVWRGKAEGAVNVQSTGKRQKLAQRTVKKMFKKFPARRVG